MTLFDNNPNEALLQASRYGPILGTLSYITQEYALLQLAKLHDPPRMNGRDNLTLKYMIENVQQTNEKKAETLKQLFEKLQVLYLKIQTARHRTLAHNDLETILENKNLGSFERGADTEYFATLKEFIEQVQDGPFEWGVSHETDAIILMDVLVKDASADCHERVPFE